MIDRRLLIVLLVVLVEVVLFYPTLVKKNTTNAFVEAVLSSTSSSKENNESSPPMKLIKERPRVVVTGCVKNAASDLHNLFYMFDRLQRKEMEIVHYIFYENNSTDRTLDVLGNLQRRSNYSIHVESESFIGQETRTVILAHARNQLWQLVKDYATAGHNFDYVLMVDMDGVNFHLKHVDSCWKYLPENWTVCCANTYLMYYDLWALRTIDDWVTLDIRELNRGQIREKFRHIPAWEAPIPVHSCFNGAAVYRYEQIQHLNLSTYYQGLVNTSVTNSMENEMNWLCEHVPFHQRLKQHLPDTMLYIQPRMLNDGKPRPKVTQRLAPFYFNTTQHPDWAQHYNRSLEA